jgi:hypothetical protein
MGWTIFVLSGALIGASACNRDSDAVMAKINETHERLDSIEQKLDALGRAGGARANANRNRRRGPEPGVLYAVPVNDNDAYRGGKNAKVTIVDAFEYA